MRGDGARLENGMAFGREGIGVEGYEGVFGVVLFEGIVEGQEAGKVFGVGDEGCPDWVFVSIFSFFLGGKGSYPFSTLLLLVWHQPFWLLIL